MYNNNNNSDHKKHNLGAPAPMNMNMSPRISFSTDFLESSSTCSNSRHQHLLNLQAASRSDAPPPGSSDFEFSVSSYSMMSADELFSQGRLLPFKNNNKTAVTLRQELLSGHDDDNSSNNNNGPNGCSSGGGVGSSRPPKSGSSGRWKGILGLRKSHVGPKKSHREDQVQSTSQHFAGHDE